MSAPTASNANADYRRWPLFWFARFEAALEAGDLAEAADAQHQLERLGLRVEPLPRWGDEEVGRAAG